MFDSNDFGEVFDRVVTDTAAYYVIGYESTNTRLDGKYRRIKVTTRRGDYDIERHVSATRCWRCAARQPGLPGSIATVQLLPAAALLTRVD